MTANHSACPDEQRLLGWLDGTMARDREVVEEHVADCPRCLDFVGEISSSISAMEGAEFLMPPLAAERLAQGRSRSSGGSWMRSFFDALVSYRAAAVLASVSVVALVAIQVRERIPTTGGQPVWRDGGAAATLTLREPMGTVSAGSAVRFVWDEVPGARAVITIVDAEAGVTVVREGVTGPSFELDAPRAAGLAGKRLEWMVECELPDGRLIDSAAVPFRISSPGE